MFVRAFLILAILTPAAAAAPVDFSREVHPILAERCFACHGGDKRSGGLSMRAYDELIRGGRDGAIIQPGRSAASLLIQRVTSDSSPMPPAGPRLSAAEIDTLRRWIDEGAPQSPAGPKMKTPWVPSLTLTKPNVPPAGAGASQQPVDRFIAAYLRKRNLTTARPVSDRVFARRTYLDIVGLLPMPEQLEQFAASREPGKRERLVTALLADKRNYTDHWVSFWNDLLRNDEGVNYAGTRKSITPWLEKALQDNMPYNRFVQELLNPLTPESPDGFLTGVNWRGDVNASQRPVIQAAQNTAQIFLGINLKCNSCHDSFISRWKLADAYGLAGFFSPDEKLELVRCDNPTGQFVTARFLYPELDLPEAPKSLNDRRAAAAKMFTDPRNGRTPRTIVNRIWGRMLGRPIVPDVDDMDGEPWSPELLDWLAADFVEHGYDVKHLIATIATSQAYQLPTVRRPAKEIKDYVFRGPEVRRMTAEEFIDAMSAVTGEWRVFTLPSPAAPAGPVPTLLPPPAMQGVYVRDWRLASSLLTRGLGRPIRDQVFTERNQDATTLQALELVNGDTLTRLLARGSRRMLGMLPAAPANIFDSGRLTNRPVLVDVDISKAPQLRLLTTDSLSYSPERVIPVWANATLVKTNGETIAVSSLIPALGEPIRQGVTMAATRYNDALRTSLPKHELVYDIAGKGYTRFRAVVGVDDESVQDDISPRVRFFVFQETPDPDALANVEPGKPAPDLRIPPTAAELTNLVFEFLLGRQPSAAERKLALDTLAAGRSKSTKVPGATAEGLSDLLWAVAMQPEFQLIF